MLYRTDGTIVGKPGTTQRGRVGGWIKLHCGDRVRSTENPRHEGRVQAVLSGMVKVKWDNGWLTFSEFESVEQV